MYEDGLYLSNLYEFLEQPVPANTGYADRGLRPGEGLRFEEVSFTYPGSNRLALEDVSFYLKPGEKLAIVGENGSGKNHPDSSSSPASTPPAAGKFCWMGATWRSGTSTHCKNASASFFQDFVRYQFKVGENIGVGDVEEFEDTDRWRIAAHKGTATNFIESLPEGFDTQLGRWFKGGQELSGGQWQKNRPFPCLHAAQGPTFWCWMNLLQRWMPRPKPKALRPVPGDHRNQMAILISHRFSTPPPPCAGPTKSIVLSGGKLIEQGTHEKTARAEGGGSLRPSVRHAGRLVTSKSNRHGNTTYPKAPVTHSTENCAPIPPPTHLTYPTHSPTRPTHPPHRTHPLSHSPTLPLSHSPTPPTHPLPYPPMPLPLQVLITGATGRTGFPGLRKTPQYVRHLQPPGASPALPKRRKERFRQPPKASTLATSRTPRT